MKINIEPYNTSIQTLPLTGQHIVANQSGDEIEVYQAYKKSIADFAVKHQQLGGSEYSYNRMSWVKPNFLWMMFRCGWAEKETQEHVLAIWIDKKDFDKLLQQAVLSYYNSQYYDSHDAWKSELETREVRLQWDPDHDPHGNKITRRALQLGIKGKMLEEFGKKDIKLIEDITDFVKEGGAFVKTNQLGKLAVPIERVYKPIDAELYKRFGIDQDMDIEKLIQEFGITGVITNETIVEFKEDSQARRNLCNYFKNSRNRAFSTYLLKRFIELRADENFELWIEDLMLASYIVGLHGNIEDSLLILEAKYADFDTYCGMDGELIAFAGLDQTIHFLKNHTSYEAKMALEHLEGFDQKEISEYFAAVESIWWI